jgi:phosphoribosylcarboxyaminoimidazole (NCAIR) mutase
MLALKDQDLTRKLRDHRQKMAKEVGEKADRIAKKK